MGKKLEFKQVKERADKIHAGKGYIYHPETYINTSSYITAECPVHGPFNIKVNHLLNGGGCGKCNGKGLTDDEREEKCRKKHCNKFTYDWGTYINTNTPMRIFCDIHGEFWMSLHTHLSSNYGCSKCGNQIKGLNRHVTQEEIINRFIKIHGTDYDYSEVEYVNYITPVKIKCNKCGCTFLQKPSDHLDGCGCNKCNNSHLENETEKLLNKYHINYIPKKQFEWLVFKQKQHLDFYLPDYNIAIECQGEQHYVQFRFKNQDNKEKLKLIQERDECKRNLCQSNNLPLYYIKYNDNIEEKLKEILKKENVPLVEK